MAETGADVILHPVRLRIVSTLYKRQLTTQQIGLSLPEVAQATLYRHLKRLVTAEVVAVVEQRPVRGVLEKVYALAENAPVRLDPRGMGPEEWERGFAAYTASLLGQFAAYLRQPGADPVKDGVSFRTGPLHLSDTELGQLGADLQAAFVPYSAYGPSPERRRRLLSTILMPDVELTETQLTETQLTENGETE